MKSYLCRLWSKALLIMVVAFTASLAAADEEDLIIMFVNNTDTDLFRLISRNPPAHGVSSWNDTEDKLGNEILLRGTSWRVYVGGADEDYCLIDLTAIFFDNGVEVEQRFHERVDLCKIDTIIYETDTTIFK